MEEVTRCVQRLIRDGIAVNIVTLEDVDVVIDLLSLPEKESVLTQKGITITQVCSRETPNIILDIKKEKARALLKRKEGLSEDEVTKLLLSNEFSTYSELRVLSRGQKLLSPHSFPTIMTPVELKCQTDAENIPRSMLNQDICIKRAAHIRNREI